MSPELDPHARLRDDVRLLGSLLGRVLQEQEGTPLFDAVEQVRALSKSARGGDLAAEQALSTLLAELPIEQATPVARAFADRKSVV